jgi:hypothetical protein
LLAVEWAKETVMDHRQSSLGPIAAFVFVFLFALIAAGASVLWTTHRDGPMRTVSLDLVDLPLLPELPDIPKAS